MKKLTKTIMAIASTSEKGHPNCVWEEPLKESSDNLIWLNLKNIYRQNGKEKTEKIILEICTKETPEYLFVYDSMYYDLNLLSLLTKLKTLSPKTKSVLISGDDDLTFYKIRYLAIFFDYVFVGQNDYIKKYEEDGLKNTKFIIVIKPVKEKTDYEKKYDVSLIASPKADRVKWIEFLIKNNINISVFGIPNWNDYPTVKNNYKGLLSFQDRIKTTCQSKINICFSKNQLNIPHHTGGFYESSLCKAFSIVEYTPQLEALFKENKEIIFFRNEKELIEKIKYYLTHEKERKEITKNAYEKIIKDFNFDIQLSNFIKETKGKFCQNNIPKQNKAIININKKLMNLPKKQLFEKIKNYDYITFVDNPKLQSKYKETLQVYSLEKNNKEISCCDYFLHSNSIGTYAQFSFVPWGNFPDRDYQSLLNPNQIMVTKNFFINNYETIKENYKNKTANFVNKNNTAFVSIPLVKISKFKKNFFNHPEFKKELSLINFSFHRKFYALKRNPIKLLIYALLLIKEILTGKNFLYSQLKIKLKIIT